MHGESRSFQRASIDLGEFPRYVGALDLVQRAATRLAALRRNDDDRARVVVARDHFEQTVEDAGPYAMTHSGRDFHVAITDASHNTYIAQVYSRLLDQGMRMLRVPFAYDPAGDDGVNKHLLKIVKEHRSPSPEPSRSVMWSSAA